jgi:hypothetical protein
MTDFHERDLSGDMSVWERAAQTLFDPPVQENQENTTHLNQDWQEYYKEDSIGLAVLQILASHDTIQNGTTVLGFLPSYLILSDFILETDNKKKPKKFLVDFEAKNPTDRVLGSQLVLDADYFPLDQAFEENGIEFISIECDRIFKAWGQGEAQVKVTVQIVYKLRQQNGQLLAKPNFMLTRNLSVGDQFRLDDVFWIKKVQVENLIAFEIKEIDEKEHKVTIGPAGN